MVSWTEKNAIKSDNNVELYMRPWAKNQVRTHIPGRLEQLVVTLTDLVLIA